MFIAALQLANGTYTIANEKNNKNESAQNVVTPVGKKCSHCDKGHTVEACWRKHPCPHCGRIGHNPNFCFSLNQSVSTSVNNNDNNHNNNNNHNYNIINNNNKRPLQLGEEFHALILVPVKLLG